MARSLALVPLAAALLLPGCRYEDRAEPEPARETEAAPAVQVTPPVSIIRPEVVTEAVEPRLAPLDTTIPFAGGGHALSAEAEAALVEVAQSGQLAEGWSVVLRGHTDSQGADEANLRASRRRAEAVAGWLVEHGVAPERIEIIALGEQRPVAPNAHPDGSPDEEGRARNRRVTVTIAPPEAEAEGEAAGSEASAAEEPETTSGG